MTKPLFSGNKLKLGILINPFAGIGGPAGLKGSDGEGTVQKASAKGIAPVAGKKMATVLDSLQSVKEQISFYAAPGIMGGHYLADMEIPCEVVAALPERCSALAVTPGLLVDAISSGNITSAEDTGYFARQLCQAGIDLLLFAGGDGTARDICRSLGGKCLSLGVPAGVKMHSAVFAVTPHAAAEVVAALVTGKIVDLDEAAEVRDIDEEAFRAGIVKSRYYGSLAVPQLGQFVQHVKTGGREDESLVICDIAAFIKDQLLPRDGLLILGSGGTMFGLAGELGYPATLLGIDAYHIGLEGKGKPPLLDADEPALNSLLDKAQSHLLILSVIGGQGYILGRGNQQLSPRVLRKIGLDNILVVCSRNKLRELEGRPLLADTGDAELDAALSGYRQVITGYEEYAAYPLAIL